MRPGRPLLPIVLAAAALAAPGSAAARVDYSGQAFNILTPGEDGGLPTTVHSTDQVPLYDGLTPLFDHVTQADLGRYYKSERFGLQGAAERTEQTGRPGLTIVRDRFDVAHVTGRTRDDVMFGSGWVTAEDRGLLLQVGRGPAYAAAVDVPGVEPFGLVLSQREFTPSHQAVRFVSGQQRVLRRAGARGRQVLRDLKDWTDGINAYARRAYPPASRPAPATLADAIAGFAFIGSIFGNGGGNEVGNADFLARLRARLGRRQGLRVFRDLKETNDPEAPVTIKKRFRYESTPHGRTPGSTTIDRGSLRAAAPPPAAAASRLNPLMSNFLVVGRKRSADGHPLAVMGPQLGYFYPEIVLEEDLHGGGVDARGAVAPVAPYVLIGRARDFAWSLTSADSDNTDEFLERLCNPDGSRPTRASTHYRYRGRCRALRRFDAGHLGAGDGEPAREVRFLESVHGPIEGTVTVHGRPYAVAKDRSTRGREPSGEIALSDLNSNRVHSPTQFFHAVNHFETTFNWPYVDSRNIAYFSSGRLPIRARGVDPSLPTLGTGRYDWRGFLPLRRHPHAINPRSGLLLNWNNKPAPGWGASDSDFAYGAAHRVELFRGFGRRMRLPGVASIMNRAATEDMRVVELWPSIARVLASGPAPSARARAAAALVSAWRTRGSSRLDSDLDGKVDDPGAAVIDAAWPHIPDAVLRPVLGRSLTVAFGRLYARSADPGPGGDAFGAGWYEYVDKDLRTLLHRHVRGRFSHRYCGRGSLARCRASLWGAIQAATDQLTKAQGADPSRWRADSTAERVTFEPGLIRTTMRWVNRPTFQQAIEFSSRAR
jgi:acyl-homoserine lactone acylase PvdQ